MIAEVEGDQITLDGNHPLAGETLHFEVSIDSIREATPEELEKGFIE
jgi:FKBP-type peptidyl-prolyl cis-trans isomerase SlyD